MQAGPTAAQVSFTNQKNPASKYCSYHMSTPPAAGDRWRGTVHTKLLVWEATSLPTSGALETDTASELCAIQGQRKR